MFLSTTIIDTNTDVEKLIDKEYSYLVLAGEDFDFESLKDKIDAHWMGAVFPKIFTQEMISSQKAFLCMINEDVKMDWIDTPECVFSLDSNSYLVFTNGLDPYINTKVEGVYSNTPYDSVLFSAGVGRSNMDNLRCMYNGKEFLDYGVIVLGSPRRLSIGVKHGYKEIKEFYNLNSAQGNKIDTIDGKDAFEFYKQIVKNKYNIQVDKDNIFEVGLKHPLMSNVTYAEDIVRVPAKTDGKSIWTVGEVYKDTFVSIGSVTDEDLISAAQESSIKARESLEKDANICFVLECLGRYSYSQKNFSKEIEAIKQEIGNLNMIGVLSLGEIANTSTSNLEIYNSTCVVGVE